MYSSLEPDQKLTLTQATMRIVDDWGLTGHGVIDILALGEKFKTRHLAAFQKNKPFPDENAVWERVDHILNIAQALRTTYPANPSVGAQWMRQSHKRFRGRAPLQVILEDSSNGLCRIRMELDCTYAWEKTGSIKGDGSDRSVSAG